MQEKSKWTVLITRHPTEKDWYEVKRRALVTVGKIPANEQVTTEWKIKALKSNHSMIRRLEFSIDMIGIPSWVATHFCRHVHAQPYVKTQRSDRTGINRAELTQDEPVNMIYDVNGEELITIAHKRLCHTASKETREVMEEIVRQVVQLNPEFKDVLVPMCYYRNGRCTEFNCCGYNNTYKEESK